MPSGDGGSIRGVVVDTSVFVAAGFRPRSASGRLVDALGRGRIRIVWDAATRGETARVIRSIPVLRWDDVSAVFSESARFEAPTDPSAFTHVPDEADRPFAALAAAAGAWLVTLDGPLLAAGVDPSSPGAAHGTDARGTTAFVAVRPGVALARLEVGR